jgi:peptidoglycan/LPS O-acetylase OafA/YrhL
MRRFEALDSWRGLCALLVVVFHLNQDINWRLLDAAFVLNFDRFVDFFFVLSGFVISAAYEARLREGYGVVPFALRRFGRIYPLHLAMLGVMIVYAVGRVLFPLSEFNPRAIFNGGIFDFTAIFTNLVLLHGIGFENHLTWNFPSWSISAEFYTYLIFALIWTTAARWAQSITLGLAAVCPLLLYFIEAPTPSALTLAQCVYGFAAGVIVRRIYAHAGPALLADRRLGAPAEALAIVLCALFIGVGDARAWLAPVVFAVVVFVFAFEAGPISALLRTKPFVTLGTLSYSIYMVHAVLIFIAWSTVSLAEAALGVTTTVPHPHGGSHYLFGLAPWIGDIAMTSMLALVIAVSAATYALIEKPGREWGRVASKRWREGGWAAVFATRPRTTPEPAAD